MLFAYLVSVAVLLLLRRRCLLLSLTPALPLTALPLLILLLLLHAVLTPAIMNCVHAKKLLENSALHLAVVLVSADALRSKPCGAQNSNGNRTITPVSVVVSIDACK
jgi:hypothetical protein